MIALTSISPKHIIEDAQLNAVNSWFPYCEKVVSFNHPTEIESLKKIYPKVEFVATERTLEHHFERKHVSVNALLDWAKAQKPNCFLLINSDIIIKCEKELIDGFIKKSETHVLIAHRNDFENDVNESDTTIYKAGIDAFFVHSNFINIYPQSIYSLGQTYWDYWIPYTAIKNKIPVILIKENCFYHKKHPAQYKLEQWVKMGRYFRLENDLTGMFTDSSNHLGRMSSYVYKTIMANIK